MSCRTLVLSMLYTKMELKRQIHSRFQCFETFYFKFQMQELHDDV